MLSIRFLSGVGTGYIRVGATPYMEEIMRHHLIPRDLLTWLIVYSNWMISAFFLSWQSANVPSKRRLDVDERGKENQRGCKKMLTSRQNVLHHGRFHDTPFVAESQRDTVPLLGTKVFDIGVCVSVMHQGWLVWWIDIDFRVWEGRGRRKKGEVRQRNYKW